MEAAKWNAAHNSLYMENIEYYEDLYLKLEKEFSLISKKENGRRSLLKKLEEMRRSLRSLRNYLEKHPFVNQQEEIYFFKYVKPKFYCAWVFAFELYQLELNFPQGTKEMQEHYLEDELRLLQRYFSQNAFYYQYYRTGATEFDALCFVRDSGVSMITVPELSEAEQDFCTACDLLFAKFMAYEKMQLHILHLLDPVQQASDEAARPSGRKITATQLNLSVDQVGLIARAADDARLLLGKSFNKVCEDLAPYIATREKQQVSAGSLRSNAYTGEDSDKLVAIRMLEKMIGFIKGY